MMMTYVSHIHPSLYLPKLIAWGNPFLPRGPWDAQGAESTIRRPEAGVVQPELKNQEVI